LLCLLSDISVYGYKKIARHLVMSAILRYKPGMTHAKFPLFRARRTRRTAILRDCAAEVVLRPQDLIQPIFLIEGEGVREPIAAMPGVSRMSVDLAVHYARHCYDLGISGVALFPATPPGLKFADGREALNPNNLMCVAIRALKSAVPDLPLIGDVALDPYTDHGHDGVLNARGDMDNDATIAILTEQALLLAKAGCDVVAPSDMTDGRKSLFRNDYFKLCGEIRFRFIRTVS
jgi:porphobilinogen synthase